MHFILGCFCLFLLNKKKEEKKKEEEGKTQKKKKKKRKRKKRGMWKGVFCITYLGFIVKVGHIIF